MGSGAIGAHVSEFVDGGGGYATEAIVSGWTVYFGRMGGNRVGSNLFSNNVSWRRRLLEAQSRRMFPYI